MQKIFVLLSALFLSLFVPIGISCAQTEKGHFMIGASTADLKFGKDETELLFEAKAGYFLIDNLAVGITPSFGYMSVNRSDSYLNSYYSKSTQKGDQWGIGPFVRYYFGQHKLRPLLNASFLFYKNTVKLSSISYWYPGTIQQSEAKIKNEYKLLQAGGGVTYFIHDRIAVEGLVNYGRYMDYEGSYDKKGELSISFGFQIFLGK